MPIQLAPGAAVSVGLYFEAPLTPGVGVHAGTLKVQTNDPTIRSHTPLHLAAVPVQTEMARMEVTVPFVFTVVVAEAVVITQPATIPQIVFTPGTTVRRGTLPAPSAICHLPTHLF
jgi:hypothetical protein